MSSNTREALWSTAAGIILPLRIVATLAFFGFTVLWLIAAFRESLLNGWLWWWIGSVAVLVASTYGYTWLRVRYPTGSDDE